jgi:glutamine cyclotransferase
VLTNREGDDFVTNLVTLTYVQDMLVAQLHRTALIMALETDFGRVQIFSNEPAFAKYCQKEWQNHRVDQVVANIMRKRGLN